MTLTTQKNKNSASESESISISSKVVAVVGLGYVGLPLAIEFGRFCKTIGYDVVRERVHSYKNAVDPSGEIDSETFAGSPRLFFTDSPESLFTADFILIAVPTPVDHNQKPDFKPLVSASKMVAQHMKIGATIVYESTVFPGATEEVCVPVLEECSGLTWKKDFNVGYSPERVNPGDSEHGLKDVVKIVAGDCEKTTAKIAELYRTVVKAGVHVAGSIKIAEAAKVIENTQRDVNIALMNELAIILALMDIPTTEVLKAAGTKWNFLDFKPGLVGGHCIGVDPYYLVQKSRTLGYEPNLIVSGRRINDSMAQFIAQKTQELLANIREGSRNSIISILGITFKENCNDIRNSLVPNIVKELERAGVTVNVCDPRASESEALMEYGISMRSWENLPVADAIILAVAHDEFRLLGIDIVKQKLASSGLFVDVKACLSESEVTNLNHVYWSL